MDDLDLMAMVAMLGLLMRNGGPSFTATLPEQAYDIAEGMVREREERDNANA